MLLRNLSDGEAGQTPELAVPSITGSGAGSGYTGWGGRLQVVFKGCRPVFGLSSVVPKVFNFTLVSSRIISPLVSPSGALCRDADFASAFMFGVHFFGAMDGLCGGVRRFRGFCLFTLLPVKFLLPKLSWGIWGYFSRALSSIGRLFGVGGPNTVEGVVITFVVDALDSQTGRLRPHILHKAVEGGPTFTDGDAPPSVIMISFSFWVIATARHSFPDIVSL